MRKTAVHTPQLQANGWKAGTLEGNMRMLCGGQAHIKQGEELHEGRSWMRRLHSNRSSGKEK